MRSCDFAFTALVLSLSLVLRSCFSSGVIQGLKRSVTLRSLRGGGHASQLYLTGCETIDKQRCPHYLSYKQLQTNQWMLGHKGRGPYQHFSSALTLLPCVLHSRASKFSTHVYQVMIANTGCPKKKYPDLVDPSDENIA